MADQRETERFVRWQKIAIDHLTFAQNIILTFTVAALAYCFTLLGDKAFIPESSFKWAMLATIIALALSALSGLICIWNRLRDFQGTAKRARGREDAPSQDQLRGIGEWTWTLFYAQLLTFAAGIVLFSIVLLRAYWVKLA